MTTRAELDAEWEDLFKGWRAHGLNGSVEFVSKFLASERALIDRAVAVTAIRFASRYLIRNSYDDAAALLWRLADKVKVGEVEVTE